jgi:ATP-dependent exoDNAse (exonuclease V) alpha subunit
MAIYHLSVKPISRAGGRSATAAAAYRSGELVHDLTSDEVFDYTRKRGVEHSEIVLSAAAARADINWARDRQALWNAAEIAEVRKDARVAREYEVALPHELNRGQRVELVRAFAVELANRYGVAVDFSIHLPHRSGDDRNHHAHIMTTTREITATGLGSKAAIEWSDTDRRKKGLEPAKTEVKAIRERWAALTNEHLLQRGIEVRVDHRSLQEQGIDREPQSHLGPAVSGMERRGMETEVGKRISWEMEAAAQARLERAAEIGKLAREREQLQLSTLDLSGDLKLAKEERARAVPEPKAKEIASGMSLAERLDMLSDDVAKRLEAEAAPERAVREEEARRRALSQQQDLEHGRGRSRGRSIGDDDEFTRGRGR